MRNAFRHAEAQRIEVEIRYDDRHFRMRVRDDGTGIAPKVLTRDGRAGHYGLQSMRERATLVGGRLDVWSKLNSSTEVELNIPATIAYRPSSGRRSGPSGDETES
jgi:signal transduction histidine kinase